MTIINDNPNGQTQIECAFPISAYSKAKTLQERNLIAMKASEQPDDAPNNQRLEKQLFENMTEQQRLSTLTQRRNGIEDTLRRLGMTEVELCDPLDRRTPIARNSKIAR